jgi:hypothetical protein
LSLSFFQDPNEDFVIFRSLRVVVSLLFLTASYYLYGKKLDKLVYWHMLFYALSSIASIFFETIAIGILCMLINFVSFTFLIVFLYSKIDFKSINRTFLIALIVGILANIWLLYYLMEMLFEMHSSTSLLVAICISILGSFTVSVLALIYNYNVKSLSSIFFVLFIMVLVFSETFRGAGHYKLIDSASGQYFGRFLLLIAYLLLFSFSYQEVFKKEKDFLS